MSISILNLFSISSVKYDDYSFLNKNSIQRHQKNPCIFETIEIFSSFQNLYETLNSVGKNSNLMVRLPSFYKNFN